MDKRAYAVVVVASTNNFGYIAMKDTEMSGFVSYYLVEDWILEEHSVFRLTRVCYTKEVIQTIIQKGPSGELHRVDMYLLVDQHDEVVMALYQDLDNPKMLGLCIYNQPIPSSFPGLASMVVTASACCDHHRS